MVAQIADQFVALSLCQRRIEPPVEAAKSGKRFVPAPGQSRWMDNFHLKVTPEKPDGNRRPPLQRNSGRPPGSLRRAEAN
jgi:hypothetical protein